MGVQGLVTWTLQGTWSMLKWTGAKSGLLSFTVFIDRLLCSITYVVTGVKTLREVFSCRVVSCCPPPPVSLADHGAITEAISVLKAAKRPLVIVGKGTSKETFALSLGIIPLN